MSNINPSYDPRRPQNFKFQRRPNQNRTRILRNNDISGSPDTDKKPVYHHDHKGRIHQPLSTQAANGHRVVLGRGALKHPGAVKHIAGARMNIIRPDAAKPMRRSQANPMIRR